MIERRGPRVLMVDYLYPPIGGVGSQRALMFAKYLSLYGWSPVVLTTRIGSLTHVYRDEADGMLDSVEIIRTANPDLVMRLKKAMGLELSTMADNRDGAAPSSISTGGGCRQLALRAFRNWASLPDNHLSWFPFAVREGKSAIQRFEPSVIFSTSSPQTSHMVAHALKTRSGLPWVADLRDLWTGYHFYSRTGVARHIDTWLERRTLSSADALTTVSEPLTRLLTLGYPSLQGRIHTITNGYDEAAFDVMEPLESEGLNILYAGSLRMPYQDPSPIFRAVRELRDSGVDVTPLRFEFFGRTWRNALAAAESNSVEEFVSFSDTVPYRESVSRQKGAKALLFIQWSPAGEGVYSMKLMEYLGAHRPVLALLREPDPDLETKLRRTGAATVVRDSDGVKRALADWLAEYRQTGTVAYHGRREEVGAFGFKELTSRLAGVLREVSVGGGSLRQES